MGNKTKKFLTILCVVLVAALVIGLNVYNSLEANGTLLRSKTAAESENFHISGTMMAYFYNTSYSQLSSVLSQLGVDTGVSLKLQACPYGASPEVQTWFDYFVAMTKSSLNELLAICEAANAAGLTLEDVDQTEIDANIAQMKTMASMYGYSLDQYLALSFGNGVNEKDVRKCLELNALATMYATQYTEGLTYTAEEMETFYGENKEEFEGVDYLSYSVMSSDFTIKDEDGNPLEDTVAASASAKAVADKIATATTVEEFKNLVREHLQSLEDSTVETVASALDALYVTHADPSSLTDVSEWIADATAGSTTVSGNAGATTYTVYFLAKEAYRDETVNRNVRHILLSSETYEDDTKATEVLSEWAAADYSDEKFAELVATYSEDEGSKATDGVYENVARGEMITEFNDWLFSTDRKAGDKEIVKTTYGWHIMEYLGEGEGSAWERTAESLMIEKDYEALLDANDDNITYHANVINKIED